MKLTIDGNLVEAAAGSTILQAAGQAGISIPTMCFMKELAPNTSCMVCVVRLVDSGRLVPACGWAAADGMVVDTVSQEVRSARKAALELLLSDHLGDCVAPCQQACPAAMDIPKMIRQIAAKDLEGAFETLRQDIALGAVLGRVCQAPCEKACRRGRIDEPVSICLLKRFAADSAYARAAAAEDLAEPNGKKVAIIGAGPAGLSAGFYLRRLGYESVIFDEHDKPGGMLRYGVDADVLDPDVLEAEVKGILQSGVEFRPEVKVGRDIGFETLRADFDAVFVGCGSVQGSELFGLELNDGKCVVDKGSFMTALEGVFAGGDVVRDRRTAVLSCADGKNAARAIGRYLAGTRPAVKAFNSRFGVLGEDERDAELFGACSSGRHEAGPGGFDMDTAVAEAGRCLYCDCRKADNCKLRDLAGEYGARQGTYKGRERKRFSRNQQHERVVYEPGKCIACGLCIAIATAAGERTGLNFINRGFDVEIAVPLGRSMAVALEKCADECVRVCPTGALAYV